MVQDVHFTTTAILYFFSVDTTCSFPVEIAIWLVSYVGPHKYNTNLRSIRAPVVVGSSSVDSR